MLYTGGTAAWTGIGKDSSSILRTVGSGDLTFDKDTDDQFVASYASGKDAESYLLRFDSFSESNNVNTSDLQYKSEGSWVSKKSGGVKQGDQVSFGSVDLTIGAIDRLGKSVVVSPGNSNVNFHTLYSKDGATVYLPWLNATGTSSGIMNYTGTNTGHNATSFYLDIKEEDKDDTIANGNQIRATLAFDTNAKAEVSAVSGGGATSTEIGDTNVERNFVYSALATEILLDKSKDQNTLQLIYHGGESAASIYLSSPTVVSAGGAATVLSIKDSEIANAAGKNLIVVGGSCVNTVAATLLGGPLCGADFTAATGVGTEAFLIETFDRADSVGNIATLVAGYEAADTVNAANALLASKPEIAAGKTCTGNTASGTTLTCA